MTPHDAAHGRHITSLAEFSGLRLPAERADVVEAALAELLALTAELEQLPLEGVEPTLTPPRWE